jgi:excisionase family DNA binding protein
MDKLLTIGEVAKLKGVRVETVRKWTQEGKLKYQVTEGGHRRYPLEQFQATTKSETRITVLYARVSSHEQKEDLSRQCQVLQSLYPTGELIKDLGSGLNYKKKGLVKLITMLTNGLVGELVITHKDRLLRFGSELIFALCEQFGTKVTILNQPVTVCFEEELVTDVLEIITVMSARLYGSRSLQNLKLMQQLHNIELKINKSSNQSDKSP